MIDHTSMLAGKLRRRWLFPCSSTAHSRLSELRKNRQNLTLWPPTDTVGDTCCPRRARALPSAAIKQGCRAISRALNLFSMGSGRRKGTAPGSNAPAMREGRGFWAWACCALLVALALSHNFAQRSIFEMLFPPDSVARLEGLAHLAADAKAKAVLSSKAVVSMLNAQRVRHAIAPLPRLPKLTALPRLLPSLLLQGGAPEEGPPSSCADQSQHCASWAQQGECDKNAAYMLLSCARSCKACAPGGSARESGRAADAAAGAGAGGREAERSVAEAAAAAAAAATSASSAAAAAAAAAAASSAAAFVCSDEDESCALWAAGGECEQNPMYMRASCPLSCGTCEVRAEPAARACAPPARAPRHGGPTPGLAGGWARSTARPTAPRVSRQPSTRRLPPGRAGGAHRLRPRGRAGHRRGAARPRRPL